MKLDTGDKVYVRITDFQDAVDDLAFEHGETYRLEAELIEVVPQDEDDEDLYFVNVKVPRVALLGKQVILPARRARK